MSTIKSKYIASVFLFAALMGSDSVSSADTYSTSWLFQSYDHAVTTTYHPMSYENVVMPIGSPWTCTKQPVRSATSGNRAGAFICMSGNASVFMFATCSAGHTDNDKNIMFVHDVSNQQDKGVMFSVYCRTEKNKI